MITKLNVMLMSRSWLNSKVSFCNSIVVIIFLAERKLKMPSGSEKPTA